MVAIAVPLNTDLRDRVRNRPRPPQLPRQGAAERDHRPAVRGLAGRIGLSLVLVYGSVDGWFGPWLADQGIQVIFSVPGMALATIFVSLPFVVREVVPVLQEIGDEQEQAAATLGARGWQTFWRITLPSIRWGVTYGVVLATARALGEFGAVAVVSGQDRGQDRDRDPAGREPLRTLQRRGRLRRRARARGDRAGDAAGDEPDPATRQAARRHRPRSRSVNRRLKRRKGVLMGITVENATKHFGDFVALDEVSIEVPRRVADRPARPERERQVDPPAGHRRARGARLRPGDHLRPGHDPRPGSGSQRRLLLPALRRLQAHDGRRQRRLRPHASASGRRPRSEQRVHELLAAGPARGADRPLPVAALRWTAPAHGARPGARGRAQGAAARRAVRRAGRPRAHRAAPVAAPAPRRGPRDDDLRHPRSGGGDGRRRADRGHERGRGRAGRRARPTSTTTRRPSSS